jgi:hypothetical protein
VRKKRAKKGGDSGWGSVENGVPLAKCDHVNGEKSSCQDFLSFLRSPPVSLLLLSLSLSLSLSPLSRYLSRFLFQKEGGRKVSLGGSPGSTPVNGVG